jgi:hypothetical protein
VRGECDRSAEDAYSSAAHDPTLAFVRGPCCPVLDFVFAFWTLIMFYILLTSLFCVQALHINIICMLIFPLKFQIVERLNLLTRLFCNKTLIYVRIYF